MDPDQLANCYLESALQLLHRMPELPYTPAMRRSALKLQAKAILGRPLTTQLVMAKDERVERLRFAGCTTGGSVDHVIPLNAIIEFAAANLRHFPLHDVKRFRDFVVPRIRTAYVPSSINALLTSFGLRHKMPNEEWARSLRANAIWARYAAVGIPPPGHPDSPLGDL
jgi:hypothetical protein